MGLYIVREIVVAHGGTGEVASTAQAGTTFTVRLPRRTRLKATVSKRRDHYGV
ncbi:ATP-binding protein [Nodosilinea sp. FACHB-141]|uniref:ATP-binding protein n=1 Tax=Cyanophyceae TaxID=3028117 RepID=UPI0037CA17D8